MKKLILSAAALLTVLSASAADLKLQNAVICANLNKDKNYTVVPANILKMAQRMAFPFRTSALLIDMHNPVKVEKIFMPLTKLVPKNAEQESGINTVQLFVGNDPKSLTRYNDFKIEVVNII